MRAAADHDVIVCVHDARDEVEACLKSLAATWNAATMGRLILVDDASREDTAALLQRFIGEHDYATLLRLPQQRFYTQAANAGLRESHASIRTLLNSDTIVTEGWADRIGRIFNRLPTVGIVGPLSNAASTQSLPCIRGTGDQTAINPLPDGVSVGEFARFIRQAAADLPVPFVPLVHGFCLSISAEAIAEIGLFDEDAFPRGYGEENDFCFRAEDAGFVLAIAIDTFVFHAKSKSYPSQERAQLMQAGMRQLVARHGEQRVGNSVRFMEENPMLQQMRGRVLQNWESFYATLSDR